MARIRTIGFDADDTLWHNENLFSEAHRQFGEVMSDYIEPNKLEQELLVVERANLAVSGFGIRPFTLSMIETALKVTDNKLDARHIGSILDIGRELTLAPVELLPDVAQVIDGLAEDYELILITKGDLKDQERKIADSGLAAHFAALEIVSDKTDASYAKIFNRHQGVEHAVMVGNSMKSDILPAIMAGTWAIHVPYHTTWALEHAEAEDHPKLLEATNITEAAQKIRRITS